MKFKFYFFHTNTQIVLKSKKRHFFSRTHTHDFTSWGISNSFHNIVFSKKIIFFLEKNFINITSAEKNFYRLYLLKIRNEVIGYNAIIHKHVLFYDFNSCENLIISFEHFQVSPYFKKKMFFKKKPNYKQFFIKIIILSPKKIQKHYIPFRSICVYHVLSIEPMILEINNIYLENYCFILFLKFTTTYKRSLYSIDLFFFYIKIILIKLEYFNSILIVKKNKINIKINFIFILFLKSMKNVFFILHKINTSNCKIVPSSSYIPLFFFYKICRNFFIFETEIQLKKTHLKKINLSVFKFTPNYKKKVSINFQKNKYRKNWFINRKWSFDFILIKESKDFLNEIFGFFFICQFNKLFQEYFLDIWLNSFYYYLNFSTNIIISVISNTTSLHESNKLKKRSICELIYLIFEINLKYKQLNFITSLAGYSLFCFVFQLKDRHNGNILKNADKKIIHIDFGYILGDFPGNLKFEANFFKLSNNFILKIGGKKNQKFEYFKEFFIRGFFLLKNNISNLDTMLRLIWFKNVFSKNKIYKIYSFYKQLKLNLCEKNIIKHHLNSIEESIENWKTIQYDKYQFYISHII